MEADHPAVRAIAFYLPQFHPIPENDEWWGPGFTEWTNVAKARPLFPGHQQPHAARRTSASTTCGCPRPERRRPRWRETYGVEAFCYWHYWFGGGAGSSRRPFTEVLASGEPSVSFCLGWANQTWTGIWHGAADRVLMEQTYPGAEDDQAHFDAIVAGVPRRALPPGRRPPGVLRLPARGAPGRRAVRRPVAAHGAAGRPRRPLPRGGVQRPPRARAEVHPRRAGRLRLLGVHPAPGPDRAAGRGRDAGAPQAAPRSRGLPVRHATRCRCPPASTPTTTRRPCTPTGTTRRARVAAAWRCTAPRRRSSARTSAPPSTRWQPGPATSGCSGSSRGTSGPRATTSSRTCEFGHGWLQVLHEELRRGR